MSSRFRWLHFDPDDRHAPARHVLAGDASGARLRGSRTGTLRLYHTNTLVQPRSDETMIPTTATGQSARKLPDAVLSMKIFRVHRKKEHLL